MHSLWGVFASCHRVVLLHAVLFLLLLLIAVENELPSMSSAVGFIGTRRSTRFAILGLVAGELTVKGEGGNEGGNAWEMHGEVMKTISFPIVFRGFLMGFGSAAPLRGLLKTPLAMEPRPAKRLKAGAGAERLRAVHGPGGAARGGQPGPRRLEKRIMIDFHMIMTYNSIQF